MSEITLEMLRAKDACKYALEEFQRRFGERVTVTEDLAASVAEVFDWNWAARALLSPAGRTKYASMRYPAWTEYLRVRDTAWAEYRRVCDQARAEYLRVRDQAQTEYKCACWWTEYLRVCDQAWAEYRRVCARIFARMYAEDRSDE